MKLRDYQQAAIDAIWGWWESGRQGEHPLVCLPTGGGKTVIFSELIRKLIATYPGVSVLILAHRKELITQAEDKLKSVWPGAPVGVYAAALKRREVMQITIASRDTIAGVIDDIGTFSFVIVDEAHRINTKDLGRYYKIIQALKDRYPSLVVIGFTATPFRLGQGRIYGHGKPFADLAYRIGMKELIDKGHLSRLTSMSGKAESIIDTSGIKMIGGDFDEKELSVRATSDSIVDSALADWKEKAFDEERKATVFFCVSKIHAEMVGEKLSRLGIDCPHVTADTPAQERDDILKGFDRGKFPAIANVGVLIEGWDCKRVDCIAMLRPTNSRALYVQMVGRGMRTFPGKQDCLVLDYGGNIERLGPVDEADEIEPIAKSSKKAIGEPCRKCSREFGCKTCGYWGVTAEGSYGWIAGCGEHNHPSARSCSQCGAPFIKHETTPTEGGILSTERRLMDFPVESVSASVAVSRKTGQSYLRVSYRVSLFEVFTENLMIGYPNPAGQYALTKWIKMVDSAPGLLPHTSEKAEEYLSSGQIKFKPVSNISVDMASRWKEIIRVDYAND